MLELWSAVQRGLQERDGRRDGRGRRRRRRRREAAVLDRIEAFRRRKPRLLDEVVTLAHGAGGKASAALLEAVFLPAFARRSARRADRRSRRSRSLRASGWRSPPTRTSCTR